MALLETDLHRIGLFARERVPEHTRFPIARLRYTKSTKQSAIYVRDRVLNIHQYDRKGPTHDVQAARLDR